MEKRRQKVPKFFRRAQIIFAGVGEDIDCEPVRKKH